MFPPLSLSVELCVQKKNYLVNNIHMQEITGGAPSLLDPSPKEQEHLLMTSILQFQHKDSFMCYLYILQDCFTGGLEKDMILEFSTLPSAGLTGYYRIM